MRFKFSFFVQTIVLVAFTATRVQGAIAQSIPILSESSQVSLISVLPGEDVYSTFGHSAIRIVDPSLGLDASYNFGTFHFGDSPAEIAGFIARFTYGDLKYELSVQDTRQVVDWYWEELGRATIEQTLDL